MNYQEYIMKLLFATPFIEIYQGEFQGNSIRFVKDIKTGEINVSAEDIAKTLGFESAHDMLSRDESLDALNSAYKATGVWPLKEL